MSHAEEHFESALKDISKSSANAQKQAYIEQEVVSGKSIEELKSLCRQVAEGETRAHPD